VEDRRASSSGREVIFVMRVEVSGMGVLGWRTACGDLSVCVSAVVFGGR